MADQLATPQDLASLLQIDYAGLTAAQQATMTLLVECGTAVVQEASGNQRIVQVVDDQGEQMGLTDAWLVLPQRPVTAISAVSIDGGTALTAGTDFKRFGERLWRRDGWAACWSEPSTITYVYTHGYATGSQHLQLGRNAVLSLCRSVYTNPGGAISEKVDDYAVTYAAMAAVMESSTALRSSLHRKYGPRAALVRTS